MSGTEPWMMKLAQPVYIGSWDLGDSERHICGYAYGVYFTNLLIPVAVFHILRID